MLNSRRRRFSLLVRRVVFLYSKRLFLQPRTTPDRVW